MQIDAAEEREKAERTGVTIEIGKFRVVANESTDADILAKVCKVLEELC